MKVYYNGLWKILIDKNLSKTKFRIKVGISTATLAKLGKNEPVDLEVLWRICYYLECELGDIAKFNFKKEIFR